MKPTPGDEIEIKYGSFRGKIGTVQDYKNDYPAIPMMDYDTGKIINVFTDNVVILTKSAIQNQKQMQPKIFCQEKKEERFVKMYKDGAVIICDKNGKQFTDSLVLLAPNGDRPPRVDTKEAEKAGIKLVAHNKWDKDQCIETLHRMLKNCE